MAYNSSSGLPMERASKIAHMELIRDESLVELLQSFRSDSSPLKPSGMKATGRVDVSTPTGIKYIVTVDGGLSVVPNPIRREKAMAFIQVGTCLLKLDDIDRMKEDPMMDPRDLGDILKKVSYRPAALPLAGVHRPHMTVKESIRHSINSILAPPYSNLYWVLEFIVFRQWMDPSKVSDIPSMNCYACGKGMDLPRGRQIFECPYCNHEHFLSDYLQIAQSGSDDWSREDAATAMMSVLEHLSILEIPAKCVKEGRLDALKQFLFIKDGPLLLRAALSRLVEPIRDFLQWIKDQQVSFYLIGVEKSGDFVNFLDEQKDVFADSEGKLLTGSYFIPSIKFLLEEVSGQNYHSATYRNRVNYGAKIGVALSERHLVVLNVPTGQFIKEPVCSDLIGFDGIISVLKELISSSYSNAIIPLVLANQAVSLSYEPSGSILTEFVDEILNKSKGAP